MAGPGDVTEGRGRGGLRASDAAREQVIDALKAAFMQGRLTKDELDTRADRIYASSTYAELAEVIADIPTALTGAPSPRAPWRATKRAWWFEYAAFLPGIVALIVLPRGPPHHHMDIDHLGRGRLSGFLVPRRVQDGRLTAREPPPAGNQRGRPAPRTASRARRQPSTPSQRAAFMPSR